VLLQSYTNAIYIQRVISVMSEIDDSMIEIGGRQFRIVKNGLDVAEAAAFIHSLIDRNEELASKLGHLHSLTKLAEKVVVNAEDQARGIVIETEKKANAEATIIIARAEEGARAKAEEITARAEKEAKERAERIIAEAQQGAATNAHEKISLAEQQARNIIQAVKEELKAIKFLGTDGFTQTRDDSSSTEEGCD